MLRLLQILATVALLSSCCRPLTLQQAQQQAGRRAAERYYTPKVFKH